MKRFFHDELQELHNALVLMGEKSLESVRLAAGCLVQKDPALAAKARALMAEIRQLATRIDAQCLRYLSLRAPVATDLRMLCAMLKLVQDLERLTEEAEDIAAHARRLVASNLSLNKLGNLPQIAFLVQSLLRETLDTLIQSDGEKALGLLRRNEEIVQLDRLNQERFSQMIQMQGMEAARMMDLAFISRCFERIGRQAVHMAEKVIFATRGEDVRQSFQIQVQR